jgi:hypothetical protein
MLIKVNYTIIGQVFTRVIGIFRFLWYNKICRNILRSIAMALSEKDLEKKNLADLDALILGCEQKSKEIAQKVGTGQAKPADMMAVNSELVLLRKVRDKKLLHDKRLVTHTQPKAAAPLRSYEDYMNTHSTKK